MLKLLKSLGVILVASVAAAGCVVNVNNNGAPSMRFDIAFEGVSCGTLGIETVRVSFPNGEFSETQLDCIGASLTTVTFDDANVGLYTVLFEGLRNGRVTHASRLEINHTSAGTHIYDIDVLSLSEVIATLTFAGRGTQAGMTCAQAGVATVTAQIGTQVFSHLACSSDGTDRLLLTGLDAGTYEMSFEAFGPSGKKLYASVFNDVVVHRGAEDNAITFNLLPEEKGGLSITWEFQDRSGCQDAGVVTVRYQIVNAGGAALTNPATIATGCINGSGPTGSAVFDHTDEGSQLDPGLFQVASIEGLDVGGNVIYAASALPIYAPAGRTQGFTVTLLP